jgi:peroxiredoxin
MATKKKKPESVNYTVTRISKQTLSGLRVMAEIRNTSVPFLIDDMYRVYRMLNDLRGEKEVKDAETPTA